MLKNNLIFVFDKRRIRQVPETNLFRLRYCPYLNFNFIGTVVDVLPQEFEVSPNGKWKHKEDYEETLYRIQITEKVEKGDYLFTKEFYAPGIVLESIQVTIEILVQDLRKLKSSDPELQSVLTYQGEQHSNSCDARILMKKIDIEAFKTLSLNREHRRVRRLKELKKINRKKRFKRNFFGSKSKPIDIIIPEILDLDQNRGQLILLINKIHKILFSKNHFRIDHRHMKIISEEALLLLTSEIERCTSVTGRKLKANRELFPQDNNVLILLNKIGYWDYFNLGTKEEYSTDEKLYLKIVGDTKVSGEKIGSLIQFFEKLICFDFMAKDKFSDAMLEAAANTVEHAYAKFGCIRTINKWWLTASLNKNTNEISFIFYDQGLGILNTLESTRKHIRLQRLFMGWINEGLSKGGILRRLLTTNLSSYKDERRGNGLISFKTFIDEVESGELTVYTDNVSYSAISDTIKDYSDNLDGTLITWRIKVSNGREKCMYIKGVKEDEQFECCQV